MTGGTGLQCLAVHVRFLWCCHLRPASDTLGSPVSFGEGAAEKYRMQGNTWRKAAADGQSIDGGRCKRG